MFGPLYAVWLYSDMAIQQSFPLAQSTAVGKLDHPEGGPEDVHVLPPSAVVSIRTKEKPATGFRMSSA